MGYFRVKLAGIDIGTNTLRLLIAEYSADGKYRTLESGRRIVRLGEGMSSAGRLKDEAMGRVLHVLKEFAARCSENHVDGIYAVATSAVRDAANGPDFISRVRNETGIDVSIISGEEEARLTMLGVSSALDISGHDALLMDIGGGSTELIMVSNGDIEFRKSTDIGVVRFTEQYIESDPPEAKDLELLEKAMEDRLMGEECFINLRNSGRVPAAVEFIGTAGTVTTLAAIDQRMMVYDPEKVNGYRMSRDGVKNILNMLASMTNKERMDLPGIDSGREDLIVAGALGRHKGMGWFGFGEMTVCDAGVRGGLVEGW